MDALSLRGGAAVVFMGSSMTDYALDPKALSVSLGLRRPAFNASLNGAEARLMEFWLLNVVVPRLRPRAVVIGVSSRELNDRGRNARRAYEAVRGSYGGRSVATDRSPTERILAGAERLSALVRYRELLRTPTRLFKVERLQAALAVTRLGAPTHIRTRGAFKQLPPFEGGFSVGGSAIHALERLVTRLRAERIRVIVVEMPMSPDGFLRHPNGIADYAQFHSALARLAVERDVDLVDLTPSFPTTEWFVDSLHLNAKGRTRFTVLITDHLRSALAAAAPA